jgi:hypothetical protein
MTNRHALVRVRVRAQFNLRYSSLIWSTKSWTSWPFSHSFQVPSWMQTVCPDIWIVQDRLCRKRSRRVQITRRGDGMGRDARDTQVFGQPYALPQQPRTPIAIHALAYPVRVPVPPNDAHTPPS